MCQRAFYNSESLNSEVRAGKMRGEGVLVTLYIKVTRHSRIDWLLTTIEDAVCVSKTGV